MPPKPRIPNGRRPDGIPGKLNAYGRFATFGIQLVVTMCLLGYAGHWADGKLGSHPWLLIVGIFLGAGGNFYSLIQAVPPVQGRPPGSGPHDSPD